MSQTGDADWPLTTPRRRTGADASPEPTPPEVTQRRRCRRQFDEDQPLLELTEDERFVCWVAKKAIPARLLDDEEFRLMTGTEVCSRDFPTVLRSVQSKLFCAARKLFAKCTLVIDLGAHRNRYVAFLLLARGRVLLHSIVQSADAPNAQHLRDRVEALIDNLEGHGIQVTGVMADNFLNLQGPLPAPPHSVDPLSGIASNPNEKNAAFIAALDHSRHGTALNYDNAPEAYNGVPMLIRCGVSILQSIVQDVADWWRAGVDLAKKICSRLEICVPLTSKWESNLNVLEAAYEKATDDGEREVLLHALQVLEPFVIAASVLHKDTATVFTVLSVLESLKQHFLCIPDEIYEKDQTGRCAMIFETIAAAIEVRVAQCLSTPAYLVLAFFCPSTRHSDERVNQLMPLVRESIKMICPYASQDVSKLPFVLGASSLQNPDTCLDASLLAYRRHADAIGARGAPQIAKALKSMLSAAASEAPVEKLFDRIQDTYRRWRLGNASPKLLETILQVTAVFPVLFPDDGEAVVKRERTNDVVDSQEQPIMSNMIERQDLRYTLNAKFAWPFELTASINEICFDILMAAADRNRCTKLPVASNNNKCKRCVDPQCVCSQT